MAWLTGWGKRKSKAVDGSTAGAQTNFQMQLTVYKSSGVDTNTQVYLGTNVRDDFGDVRFTDTDGTTLLDYWIETLTSGVSAVIWIEIPSIPISPGSTNIYIYYDNASETTTSNGATTFPLLFDHFEGSALDSKWNKVYNKGGTVTVANSIAYFAGTGVVGDFWGMWATTGASAFSAPYVLEMYAKVTDAGGGNNLGAKNGDPAWNSASDATMLQWYDGAKNFHTERNTAVTSIVRTGTYTSYSIIGISNSGSTVKWFKDRIEVDTPISTNVPTDPIYAYTGVLWTASQIWWDWVFVRKYANPEPTFGETILTATQPVLGSLYSPIQRGIGYIAGIGASLGRSRPKARAYHVI